MDAVSTTSNVCPMPDQDPRTSQCRRHWYAVFTIPRNEKSVEKQLNLRQIECFLPTYERQRVWKNQQRVKTVWPLFPTYLFVHIERQERARVLQSPGVLRIVGNHKEPLPLADSEIEFLRSDFCKSRVEPFAELAVGQKVRVRRGIMEGLEGVLVRKNNQQRFVITLSVINQHAAIEVPAAALEALSA